MSFAFLPLYTGDYLRDTAHLSPREHGVYILMLMWCWQHAKPMPNDMLRICRTVKAKGEEDEKAVAYVLTEFFQLRDDGCYHNKRLEAELKRSNKLIERGKAGAAGRWGKINGNAKPMLDGCLSDAKSMDPTTTPTTTPNTITNTNTNTKTLKPLPLPSWLPLETWKDYLNHRRSKRAKVSPENLKYAIKQLEKLRNDGHDPQAVLERSMANGWTGLFPLDAKGKGGQPGIEQWLRNQEKEIE